MTLDPATAERRIRALELQAQVDLSGSWWLGPTRMPAEAPDYPDLRGFLGGGLGAIRANATRLVVTAASHTHSRRYLCNAALVAERMIRLSGGEIVSWDEGTPVYDTALHELDWDDGPEFVWPWCVTAELGGERVFVLPPQVGTSEAVVIFPPATDDGEATRSSVPWTSLTDRSVTQVRSAVVVSAMSRPLPTGLGLATPLVWSWRDEAQRFADGERVPPSPPSPVPPEVIVNRPQPAPCETVRGRVELWETTVPVVGLLHDAIDRLNADAWVAPVQPDSGPMTDLRLSLSFPRGHDMLAVQATDTQARVANRLCWVQVQPACNAVALAATVALLAGAEETPELAQATVPAPGTRWGELSRGQVRADGDTEQPDLPWPWSLVGNLKHGTVTTPDGITRPNSRVFRNGAKLILLPPQWGDGWEYAIAVGQGRRKPHRYTKSILPSKRIEHFRVQQIRSPAIVRAMMRDRAGADWWASREQAELFLASIHEHQPEEAAWWQATHGDRA